MSGSGNNNKKDFSGWVILILFIIGVGGIGNVLGPILQGVTGNPDIEISDVIDKVTNNTQNIPSYDVSRIEENGGVSQDVSWVGTQNLTKIMSKVPKYSGEHTYEIGKATFTQEDMEAANSHLGEIVYGGLDAQNRALTANAVITKGTLDTGTSAKSSIRPPGFETGEGVTRMARCHLIGNQLGGSGSVEDNLIAGYQNNFNVPAMVKIENAVRKLAEEGKSVRYRVAPVYVADTTLAVGVVMEYATLDGSESRAVFCYNNHK